MNVRISYTLFPPSIRTLMNCKDSPCSSSIYYEGKMKFDPGADITCIPASYLGINAGEAEFTKWIQTTDNIELIQNGKKTTHHIIAARTRGVDKKAASITSYALQLDDFQIITHDGVLDLGGVPVFVVFDDRFQTPLLGRDILGLLNMEIDNDKNLLTLSLSEKCKNAIKQYGKISPQYFIKSGIYDRDIFLVHDSQIV